jgi:hypothetical protein
LEDVAEVSGVRHVRVASGWRMDLGLADKTALGRMIREFTGGQAKVAPEHKGERILRLMRKPSFTVFEEFVELFERESARAGKEQYVIPYLMSAFPGCTEEDMRELAGWLKSKGWKPSQVQCFIPLPGTAAAAMYFAGTDLEGNPLHVATTDAERLSQHAILTPERCGRPGRPALARPNRPVSAKPGEQRTPDRNGKRTPGNGVKRTPSQDAKREPSRGGKRRGAKGR